MGLIDRSRAAKCAKLLFAVDVQGAACEGDQMEGVLKKVVGHGVQATAAG